jgi:hypothetical protein
MKNYYTLFSLLFLVVLLGSCRGDEQNKLIGNWEQIPFTNPDSTPTKIFWRFYAGDAVTIFRVSGEVTDSLQYTYNISGQVFDVFPGIDDVQYLTAARDPRGQYWVDMLKDSQFKATKRKHPDGTTGAAFMRVELVKR